MSAPTTAGWVAVCRVEDVPATGARRIARNGLVDVALFRTGDDRLFALLDRCPHKGGPLSQGIVFGEHVACPLHGWTIGLASGAAREPDVGCTPSFAVHVADGVVHLDAGELATLGAGLERPLAGPARRAACAA